MNIIDVKSIKDSNCYIVDFSYILYRSYYALNNLGVKLDNGLVRPTGHIVGTLSTITGIKDYDENAIIFVALDGYPQKRKELCESVGIDYKGGRSKPEFNIKSDISTICDLLCHIPDVYLVENEDAESDDIMFALSRDLDKSNTCYIYTSDNDLLQAINDNTFIISKWENGVPLIVDLEYYSTSDTYVKKYKGCKPNKLPFYRAMIGDSSDNIKGIYRMNKDLARIIAESMNDVSDFDKVYENFYHIAKTPSKKNLLMDISHSSNKRVKVNYEIMRLYDDLDYVVFREKAPIKSKLDRLQLNSFVKWLSTNKIDIL